MDIKETINKIADDHHGFLKQEIPVIKNLAYKILRVHYHDCKEELIAVHRQYGRVYNEIELGFVKKQMVVFPTIWDYEKNPSDKLLNEIKDAVEEVEKDNALLLKELESLREVTNNYTMPESGCGTYDTTYKKMEKIHSEIEKHLKLEENMYREILN